MLPDLSLLYLFVAAAGAVGSAANAAQEAARAALGVAASTANGLVLSKGGCFAAYLMWSSPFFCCVLLALLSKVVMYATLWLHVIAAELRDAEVRTRRPRSLVLLND